MKSLYVRLEEKTIGNMSSSTFITGELLSNEVKVLVVGLPNSCKSLLIKMIKDKLTELGVPKDNIEIDSLDGNFDQEELNLSEALRVKEVTERLRNVKYSLHEVHA